MRDEPSSVPVFYSNEPQRSPWATRSDVHRLVRARKLVQAVNVRFADQALQVNTLEGIVHAAPGDAVVTGVFGEPWAVARSSFAGKYEAVPPLEMGAPGLYRSLPIEVLVAQMHEPFEVVLADGKSQLRGQAGDWLVDYGDGSLGIVNADIFAVTYEIMDVD